MSEPSNQLPTTTFIATMAAARGIDASVPQEDLRPTPTLQINRLGSTKHAHMLLGVVGEGLWPSKCCNIMAMHLCHNKGEF